MSTTTTTQIKDQLNMHLKNHPKYEDWMCFDEVESKEGIGFITRYKSPQAAGVAMSLNEAMEIYNSVCSDIIKPQ